MSDEALATTETPPVEEDQTPKEIPAWARREISRRDDRIQELEKDVRLRTFEAAGIDTDKGLGKKIAEHYSGPVNDVDALVEFAKEYEYPFSTPPPETVAETVNNPDEAIATVMTQTTPVVVDQDEAARLDREIAEAEAAGNWAQAANLKAQRFPHPG